MINKELGRKLSWHGNMFYRAGCFCDNIRTFSIEHRNFTSVFFLLVVSLIQIIIGFRSPDAITITLIMILLFVVGVEKVHDSIIHDHIYTKVKINQEKARQKWEDSRARTNLMIGTLRGKISQSS